MTGAILLLLTALTASPSDSELVGKWHCEADDGQVEMVLETNFKSDHTADFDIVATMQLDPDTTGVMNMLAGYDWSISGDTLSMINTGVQLKKFLMNGQTLAEVLGDAEAAKLIEQEVSVGLVEDMAGETQDRIDVLTKTALVFVSEGDNLVTTCSRK